MNVWRVASELARSGQRAALATVAATRGSTPVPAGEKMLVGPEGRLVGTVGGGCVEAEVIAAALAAQSDATPRLLTQHLNADLAGDLGLSCGGTVEIFVEADFETLPEERRRFALLNIPRHLFSEATAATARRTTSPRPASSA